MKSINPERRALNVCNALVVILSDFTHQSGGRGLWRLFCLRQKSTWFFHCSCQASCLLASHSGLPIVLSSSLQVAISVSGESFPNMVGGISIFLSSPKVPWEGWPHHFLQIKLLSLHFIITECLVWASLRFPSVPLKNLISALKAVCVHRSQKFMFPKSMLNLRKTSVRHTLWHFLCSEKTLYSLEGSWELNCPCHCDLGDSELRQQHDLNLEMFIFLQRFSSFMLHINIHICNFTIRCVYL